MKHKHYELIMAWANGAEIEYLSKNGNGASWKYIEFPAWSEDKEYRIKPEPKPDVVLYAYAENCNNNCGYISRAWLSFEELIPNIKLIYDSETNELKSVEKI